MVVVWTNLAKQNLKKFKEITKKVDPDKYIEELIKYVENLKINTKLGKISTYVKGKIIRQLIYKEHIIYYFVEEEKIYILSVIHSREDSKRKLKYIKDNFNY